MAYTVIGLLVEVNSVFLHGRKLLQQTTSGSHHPLYGFTIAGNILTFIVFRLVVLVFLFHAVYVNRSLFPMIYKLVLSLAVPFVGVVNVILFWRLIRNDYRRHNAKWEIRNNNSANFETYDEKLKTS